MARYSDGIEPGLDLGSREIVLGPEWLEKYMGSIADRNPWYTDASPWGGAIAPSAVFNYEMLLFDGWHPPGVTTGILNTGQVWEFHRPLRPGQRILLRGRVHDRYLRRGREHIAMEATAWDQDGQLLCRSITTDAWPVAGADAEDLP